MDRVKFTLQCRFSRRLIYQATSLNNTCINISGRSRSDDVCMHTYVHIHVYIQESGADDARYRPFSAFAPPLFPCNPVFDIALTLMLQTSSSSCPITYTNSYGSDAIALNVLHRKAPALCRAFLSLLYCYNSYALLFKSLASCSLF